MYSMTLQVPKPFSTGPQFNPETGELIPGSWPGGFGTPSMGFLVWHSYAAEKGGKVLVDCIVADVDSEWVDGLPGPWNKTANYHIDDTTLEVTIDTPMDEPEYMKHQPDDEFGDPATVYRKMHGMLGHNEYEPDPVIDPIP